MRKEPTLVSAGLINRGDNLIERGHLAPTNEFLGLDTQGRFRETRNMLNFLNFVMFPPVSSPLGSVSAHESSRTNVFGFFFSVTKLVPE